MKVLIESAGRCSEAFELEYGKYLKKYKLEKLKLKNEEKYKIEINNLDDLLRILNDIKKALIIYRGDDSGEYGKYDFGITIYDDYIE